MDWDADDARYMATGLDAFHCGVEASLFQRVGRWLEANAFASIGNWRWMKDVSAGILAAIGVSEECSRSVSVSGVNCRLSAEKMLNLLE